MLVKLGVDVSRLRRPIRRTFNKTNRAFLKHGESCVVSSTYEGDHMPSSLHYSDEAYDCRPASKDIDPTGAQRKMEGIAPKLKIILGGKYDVILGRGYIHIEYDPKEDS